jgi:hypothetical protein
MNIKPVRPDKNSIKTNKNKVNNQSTHSAVTLMRTNTRDAGLRTQEIHLYDVYQQNTQTRIKINQGSFEL